MKKLSFILLIGLLMSFYADAGRKPCSGSKGGISHCTAGGKFVCNDGSISASKKTCTNWKVKRGAMRKWTCQPDTRGKLPALPLPGRAGHEGCHLLFTVPEPQFIERLSGQECECQYCETNNEQTRHQGALHSLSLCRMAGKRLTSELCGSFVGRGW